MGHIDPIYTQFGTENPFFETAIKKVQSQGSSSTSAADADVEMVIDESRLARQRVYLDQVTSWILDRGYRYFRMGLYEQAQAQFQQYFRYQLFYGSLTMGTTNQFYNALFTMSWVDQTQNTVQASVKQYNELLQRILEPYTHDTREGADQREHPILRPYIEHLQLNGQFPTPAHLEVLPTPDTMVKLAAKLITTGERQAGFQVINFARAFEASRIYPEGSITTRVQSDPIFRGYVPKVSDDLIRELYGLHGLPYIPGTHSLEADDDHLHKAKVEITDMDLAQYFTHRVEPIDKDPNDEEERRKREEKLEEEIEEHAPDSIERKLVAKKNVNKPKPKKPDDWDLDVSVFD